MKPNLIPIVVAWGLIVNSGCGDSPRTSEGAAQATAEQTLEQPLLCTVEIPGGWTADGGRVRGPSALEFEGTTSVTAPSGTVLSLKAYVTPAKREFDALAEDLASLMHEGSKGNFGRLRGPEGFHGAYRYVKTYKNGRASAFAFVALLVNDQQRAWMLAGAAVLDAHHPSPESDWMPPDDEIEDMIRIAESMRPHDGE
jgi:hypothetical protein